MARRNTPTTNSARIGFGGHTWRIAALAFAGGAFFAVLIWSGVTAFQRQAEPVPLAATDRAQPVRATALGERPAPRYTIDVPVPSYEVVGAPGDDQQRSETPTSTRTERSGASHRSDTNATYPADVKYDRLGNVIMVDGQPWTGETFDHRPIRPVKTRTMKTTAYSPDERSCGKWADGITASGKSVWMNGGRLVAADRKIPYGTILTIPGYNYGKPVQVWDRGGKIKGNRLDLLYPTHEIARQWGVQDLPVVFWEFVETD